LLVLWTYWYAKSEQSSIIFVVNGLLIFSIWFRTGVDIIVRYVFLVGDFELQKAILVSDMWAYRIFLQIVILLWLLTWIVSRIYKGEEYFKKPPSVEKTRSILERLNILVLGNLELSNTLRDNEIYLNAYNIDYASSTEEGLKFCKGKKYFLILLGEKCNNTKCDNLINFVKSIRKEDNFVFLTIYTDEFFHLYNSNLMEYIDDIVIAPLDFERFRNRLVFWNLRYKRRLYFLNDLGYKIDHLKNIVSQILEEKKLYDGREDIFYG
jgi:hypothetical protein